jgi:hypothetical protein
VSHSLHPCLTGVNQNRTAPVPLVTSTTPRAGGLRRTRPFPWRPGGHGLDADPPGVGLRSGPPMAHHPGHAQFVPLYAPDEAFANQGHGTMRRDTHASHAFAVGMDFPTKMALSSAFLLRLQNRRNSRTHRSPLLCNRSVATPLPICQWGLSSGRAGSSRTRPGCCWATGPRPPRTMPTRS